MSLKTRRILFVLFVLAFLAISALVISYAAGYKITLGGRKPLQKTGMLILDTKPRGAKIYLNGKPEQLFFKRYFDKEGSLVTTPAKIKNLLPGEYEVKMELPGYWSWQKKLEVRGGVSTYAEDVNLFKKNLPFILSEGVIIKTSLSPNNEYLAVISEKETYIIELKTENKILLFGEKNTLLIPNAFSSQPILWSPESAKILMGNFIFQINRPDELIDLDLFVKQRNSQFRWGLNDDEVLFNNNDKNNGIYSFNLISKNIKQFIISEGKIIDFLIKNGNLFTISGEGKKTNLNVYEANSSKKIRSIELLLSSDYQFINHSHQLINILDGKHQILYLIEPLSLYPLQETINNVKHTYWVQEDRLLYANDFEIWLMDIGGQKKLLTRRSEPISGITWHPSNNYVIYSTSQTINSIELDEREKRNITELIKLDEISNIYFNKKGDILYFSAKIGREEGIYKLAIQ